MRVEGFYLFILKSLFASFEFLIVRRLHLSIFCSLCFNKQIILRYSLHLTLVGVNKYHERDCFLLFRRDGSICRGHGN